MSIIDIDGLGKKFGRVTALDGFDMIVEEGEIAAFLGPNGAGKSTTIRILLGMIRADRGTVKLFGQDPWSDAAQLHRRLAYVPGDVNLWPSLTGGEAIDTLLRLGGQPGDTGTRDQLLQRFELDPSRKCHTYSKGNRQKVALVAALAADVDLYVFDEPTAGLDPLMERVFQDCAQELHARGRTVLLSSHILAQVEKLCTTVTIIRAGQAVQHGRLDDLRHLHRTRVRAVVEADPNGLERIAGIHHLRIDGQNVTFTVDREESGRVMEALAGLGVSDTTWTAPSLEDLFISEYSDGAR